MSRRLTLLLPLLASLPACAKTATPTDCQSNAQCPAESRCEGGLCTADGRPVASLRPAGAVETYALVELDGSASRDPDPGDAIAEHRWTIRSVEAPCAPPEVAGRGPRALVRFGCPGRYEVELVVRDRLGVEGAPVTAEVTATPPTGEPLVLAGPDVATEHVCRGSPLVCRTESRIALAAAADPRLALRWSVVPPADRPLDASRRVLLVPDGSAAGQVAVIETDGTAISGDWIFRVEARDAYGVVGAASTRVSVRNRAPVVAIAPAGPFPHAFDPSRSAFLSSGEVGFSIVDPDGDPFEVAGIWRHVGDGEGATFDGELAGTTATFSVEVPYAAPEDALRLIGGAGLSRRIEIYALDANRTEGAGVAEIEIGNRPPVWIGGVADSSVPHRFDRAGSRYVATARGGTFVDPDGDPMFGAPSEGPCGTVTLDGGEATVECSAPFQGVPALDRLVGTRTFPVRVRDAWGVTANAPVRTVEILNAPPVVAASRSPATICGNVWLDLGGGCPAKLTVSPVAFDVDAEISDPDGDPVLVAAVPRTAGGTASLTGALLSGPGRLSIHFTQPPYVIGTCTPEYQTTFVAATDGAAEVKAGVSPEPRRCN